MMLENLIWILMMKRSLFVEKVSKYPLMMKKLRVAMLAMN